MRGLADRRAWRRLAILAGVAAYALLRAPASTEPAQADGDTRTLTFVNNHTNETGSFTYRVNGAYDADVLEKLNWFMRDWRLNEQTKMDPKLFDILWDVYREAGSSQPIDVLSAYRSPQTNAMLRRRSRLVAEKSQHMEGRAIDAHFMDLSVAKARDVAMRMQEGGVGFYPIGNTPWVHIDSGTVRYWPRMSRASLARLFPDGKTVFIPADGQPMEGYAEAKAMIEARGGDVQVASNSGGLFSWLFGGARGGGEDDAEESGAAPIIASGRGGPPMAMGGRGGMGAAVTAAAVSALPPAADPAPAPPPPPPPPAEQVALAPAAPAAPADQDSQAADAAPAANAPDETVDTPAAPLPPRRPMGLLAEIDMDVPAPPKRPNDLTIPPTPVGAASPSDDDLVAALIERKALPNAITKGVHPPTAPKTALALTDSRKPADVEALARATTLAAPPLPPMRPRPEGVTKAERAAPAPEPPARPTRHSAANPFGGLVVDAFNTGALKPVASVTPELRGDAQ